MLSHQKDAGGISLPRRDNRKAVQKRHDSRQNKCAFLKQKIEGLFSFNAKLYKSY